MTPVLLSLTNSSIEKAIERFSRLAAAPQLLTKGRASLLCTLNSLLISTYLRFFKQVSFAKNNYELAEKPLYFNIEHLGSNETETISYRLSELIGDVQALSVLPINIHLNQNFCLSYYAGIGYAMDQDVNFYLNHLILSENGIYFPGSSLLYLDQVLKECEIDNSRTVRQIAADSGKSYQVFQSDCKLFFRDTFHQFLNKLRMLRALEDIMLSDDSLKEIAYRHQFGGYNNMSFLFRRYQFLISSIPRLYSEI